MGGVLQCDEDDCDHVEEVEAISEDMIGKPCPKCGASLLTQEDYDFWVERIQPAFDLMRELGLAVELPADAAPPEGMAKVSVHAHNNTITTKIEEN